MQQIGRYQIEGELGRGAMGVVYRATDPAIGRTIAIKSIRLNELADQSEREKLRERLFREAQSAGILSHPSIVTIYDILEENDYAYIFMEFVNGPTLEKLLLSGQLPEKNILIDFFSQTAAALDYAHKKGIVHRDIKPANIMIQENVTAKITDFGVAKFVSQQITQSGAIFGTPNYMSPEQIQGIALDGRADQFALAVITYEVLTGEKPFAAEYLPSLLYKIVRDEPAAPQHLNPSLGTSVGIVLAKALSKNPADRYDSCTEFVKSLKAACAESPDWVPLPRGASPGLPTMAVLPLPEMEKTNPYWQGRPAPPPPFPARQESQSASLVGGASAPVHPQSSPVEPSQTVSEKEAAAAAFAGSASLGSLPPLPDRTKRGVREEKPLWGRFAVVVVLLALLGAAISTAIKYRGTEQAQQMDTTQKQDATAPPVQPNSPPAPQPQMNTTPATTQPQTPPPSQAEEQPVVKPAPTLPALRAGIGAEETKLQIPAPASPGAGTQASSGLTQVRFATDPARASVRIDEGPMSCITPCYLYLTPGRHTLSAFLDSYSVEKRIFDVPSESSLFVSLTKRSGTIHIASQPAGATILVDGIEQPQKTPATLRIPIGTHKISLVKDSYRHEETIVVGQDVLINRSVKWVE